MFMVARLFRLIAFITPPTARFWMCGRFPAKNPDDLTGFALEFQGLQIVSKQNQVHFRAQAHRRMAPVAVGENPELAAPD